VEHWTKDPFRKELLRILEEERGWSLRELMRQIKRRLGEDFGVSAASSQLVGDTKITERFVDLSTRTLGLPDLYFPEARAFRVRQLLDPKDTDQMLKNLPDFEPGLASPSSDFPEEVVELVHLRNQVHKLRLVLEAYFGDHEMAPDARAKADAALWLLGEAIEAERAWQEE
jgi:hypothetical protein